MSADNSTGFDFRAIEVNTPALSIIRDSTVNAGDTMVEIALFSLLFGESESAYPALVSSFSQSRRNLDSFVHYVYVLFEVGASTLLS